MSRRKRQGDLFRESENVLAWWICLLRIWSIVRRLGMLCRRKRTGMVGLWGGCWDGRKGLFVGGVELG